MAHCALSCGGAQPTCLPSRLQDLRQKRSRTRARHAPRSHASRRPQPPPLTSAAFPALPERIPVQWVRRSGHAAAPRAFPILVAAGDAPLLPIYDSRPPRFPQDSPSNRRAVTQLPRKPLQHSFVVRGALLAITLPRCLQYKCRPNSLGALALVFCSLSSVVQRTRSVLTPPNLSTSTPRPRQAAVQRPAPRAPLRPRQPQAPVRRQRLPQPPAARPRAPPRAVTRPAPQQRPRRCPQAPRSQRRATPAARPRSTRRRTAPKRPAVRIYVIYRCERCFLLRQNKHVAPARIHAHCC